MRKSRPRAVLLSVSRILLLGLAFAFGPAPSADAQDWNLLSPTGTAPSPRRQQGMVVDDLGDRLIVVGGENGDDGTWALSLLGPAVWTNLNVTAPPGASDVVQAILDPQSRRMVLVLANCSVWTLDLANPTAWQELIAEGNGPAPRNYPVVVHDALRNRLILFGGGPDTGLRADVWALNLTDYPVWRQITPPGPGPIPRWAAVGVYDAPRDRLVISSGRSEQGLHNDVWALPLANPAAWSELHPTGPPPPPRYLAAATFDPVTHEMILFGGHTGSTGVNDLWMLDLLDTSWNPQLPAPGGPSIRWSHRVAYHGAAAAMVTYGGWDGDDQYRTDPWTLSRPTVGGQPKIFGFSPAGGRIGDQVTIFGRSLEVPLGVTIGGAVAQVLSSTDRSIQAVVPAGASPGPITVTTNAGTAVSAQEYFVGEDPVIARALPDSGRAGETIELRGRAFTSAIRISFGGVTSAAFTVLSDTAIAATPDTLAGSGPIHITTLVSSSQSAFTFTVIPDDPRPRLLSVRDVENDQGGSVVLRWRASDFDQFRYRSITGYRVWRRAPLAGMSAELAAANGWKSGGALALAGADPDAFWESVAELPATFLPGYAYTATTLQDSTELGNPYTAFFVQALTKDVFKFYNSAVDSGYSVDDLAPHAPTQVAVRYESGGNTIQWRGRELPDLRGYRIHRGPDALFAPSVANLVVTTTNPNYVDVGGHHFYKLAAVDVHGNVSRYVAVSPDHPVGTLVSFLRTLRERGLARVVWLSGGNPNLAAKVYRRTESTDWEQVGDLLADGLGYLTFEDRDVMDDARYGYRLGVLQPGEPEELLAETWIDPLAVSFALAGRVVNPSTGGRIACAFAVPYGARAEASLFDVAGREVERHVVEPGASGERTVRFGETQRLRAGVYLLRASGAGRVVTKRVVVLD